jgi:hypothetical protein
MMILCALSFLQHALQQHHTKYSVHVRSLLLSGNLVISWMGCKFLSSRGLVETNPGPEYEWDEFLSDGGLKIICQNVGRLMTSSTFKMNSLRTLLINHKGPLVLVLTESWLTDRMDCNLFKIQNLKCTRFDRAPPNRSMGLVLYHSSELSPREIVLTQEPTYSLLKTTLTYEGEDYTACFIYRPPRINQIQQFFESFESRLDIICDDPRRKVILMGDLNLDLLHPETRHNQRLLDITTTVNLHQHISNPTRVALLGERVTSTLIDHVYSTDIDFPHSFGILNSDNQLSDHNAIGVLLKSNIGNCKRSNHKHTYESVIDYTDFDEGYLRRLLQQVNWGTVENEMDLDQKWTFFVKKLKDVLDLACRRRRIRTCTSCRASKQKTDLPWYTPELKLNKKIVNSWLTAFKSTKLPVHFATYKEQLRLYKSKTRRACRAYHTRQLQQANTSRETHKIIDRLLGKGKQFGDRFELLIGDGGVALTDSKSIANEFNAYFTQIGAVAAAEASNELPRVIAFDRPPPELQFIPPGFYNTLKCLQAINANKPSGPDGIPGKIFKTFAPELLYVLENIFAACVYRSTIPKAWKHAYVTPVYKKGIRSDPSNYRPIAITSVIPKIFEKILYNQLINHFESNNLLSSSQYGYRAGMSTTHAVLDVTEKIRSLAAEHAFVGLLLIDLSKAFDCVNHGLLINMLSIFGLDRFSCEMLRSFLTGRSQCVKVNGTLSDSRPTVCGVPQGSLLGPILFDVYVNFLSQAVQSHIVQYADDVAMVRSHTNYNELKNMLGNDLRALIAYFRDLGLRLNVGKTEFMVFGNPVGDLQLVLDDVVIPPVTSLTYLGITIDHHLKFDLQNKLVINKLKRANFLIRAIRSNITLRVAKQLLHMLVYSHHDYACIVWAQLPNSRLALLMEKQHRFCLKSVFQKGWRYSTDMIYRLAQQPELYIRRQICMCTFVHSVISQTAPPRFLGAFEISATARGRADLRLVVPRALRHTNFVRDALRFRAVSAWNALELDVRTKRTSVSFACAIKSHFRPIPL